MNRRRLMLALCAMLTLFTVTGLGCSHLERVSGKTFVEKASELPTPTYCTTYIGTAGGNAYLQEWLMLPWQRTNVLWTPLTDLPPEVVMQLKDGENPWSVRNTPGPSK